MGMGNISLKNVDTITKIKNVAEHLAHAKYPTTSSTMALGKVPMQSTIWGIICIFIHVRTGHALCSLNQFSNYYVFGSIPWFIGHF